MKNIGLIIPLVLALLCGCTTTDQNGNTVVDTVKTEKVAGVLQQTVSSVVLIGIQKESASAGYLRSVGVVICSLTSGGAPLTPAALSSALQTTTINEIKTVEAQLAVNFIVGLYSTAYADRLNADVDANIYAKTILAVLCAGITNGLDQAKGAGLIP